MPLHVPNSAAAATPSGTPGAAPTSILSALPLHLAATANSNVGTANRALLNRVTVHKTGTLNAIAILSATASGNVDVGVYSPGSTCTRLYSTGSIACPTANTWAVVGTPSLAVTVGDDLYLTLAADNTTATFARGALTQGGGPTLPAGWWDIGGSAGRFFARRDTSFPLPSSFAYTDLAEGAVAFAVIARIA